MILKLKDSPLFRGMTGEDIECCLKCSHAQSVRYDKDEMIFCQGDAPEKLSVLIDGSVAVCNDSADGRRSIVASIDKPGELFGEVFVFLGQKEYDKAGESPAITMNREEMADFLNVARPSLSRELMRMQEEGLVKVTKRGIFVPDSLALQKIL